MSILFGRNFYLFPKIFCTGVDHFSRGHGCRGCNVRPLRWQPAGGDAGLCLIESETCSEAVSFSMSC
jgi:hypothetical protein